MLASLAVSSWWAMKMAMKIGTWRRFRFLLLGSLAAFVILISSLQRLDSSKVYQIIPGAQLQEESEIIDVRRKKF